jgi:DNA-binding XRE family transcriptional regulator
MVKVKPEQIKLIMKVKKVGLVQMAKELGVTRQAIHGIMSGKPVSGKLIGRLIQYSGLDFSDIFFIDDITLASTNILHSIPPNSPQDESLPPETMNHSGKKKQAVL